MPYVLVGAAIVVLWFPIAWMVSSSLKLTKDLFTTPPVWIPTTITLQHYVDVLANPYVLAYIRNSSIVTGATTIVGTALAIAAGYALSRLKLPGSRLVLVVLLVTQTFPQVMFLIPLFRFWASVHGLDSDWTLVVSELALILPLAIWLMASFFEHLPAEIEEAALVDGASHWQVLTRVALPLIVPGVVVVALFTFLSSWDEYLFTSTLIHVDSARTLPVGMVAQYIGMYSYSWDKVMAMAVAISLPVMVLFSVFQRQFVQGVTSGYTR